MDNGCDCKMLAFEMENIDQLSKLRDNSHYCYLPIFYTGIPISSIVPLCPFQSSMQLVMRVLIIYLRNDPSNTKF